MERDRQKSRPDGAPKSQIKPNQPEQKPQGGGIKSPERQSLPSAWDILDRQVKLWAPEVGKPIMSKKAYIQEAEEVKRLKDEVREKGTDRERNIFALFDLEQKHWPDHPDQDLPLLLRRDPRSVYIRELHQLRSLVEPMSDEVLAQYLRQHEQYYQAIKRGE
jgi:hypothetical protein